MIHINTLFADGMVLQREKEIHVWGECDPGTAETVRVSFDGQTVDAVRKENCWQAVLPAHGAAVGLTMTVSCGEERLELSDISVGDVWVAGGQSNMEYYLKYEQQVWAGNYPQYNDQIRFYDVPEIAYEGQEEAFDYSEMSVWRKAVSREDLDYFSAVAFYFAQKVYEQEQIPIGILGCNWGGTAILAWMNPESVERVGKPWHAEVKRRLSGIALEEYYRLQNKNPMNDTGNPMKTPFTEFMVPVARTDDEAAEFMSKQAPAIPEELLKIDGLVSEESKMPLMPTQIPGCLYEHMVKRIADFPIRGFLYYQGESDDEMDFGPGIYDRMFSAMIDDWRALWKDETLPFLAVQLAPFRHWNGIDARDYVTLRQKQKDVADQKQGVYLACIGDAGMEWDIHPKDKKTVGERLALLALCHVYGHELLCEAPAVREIHRSAGEICVRFDHAGEGLYVDESKKLPLQIVDREGRQVPFTCKVCADTLKILLASGGGRMPGAAEAESGMADGMPGAAEAGSGTADGTPGEQLNGAEPCSCGGPQGSVKLRLGQTNWYVMNLFNSAGIPAFPFESGWLEASTGVSV